MPKRAIPLTDRFAINVREFCELVGISSATFYRLPPEKRPPVITLGDRRLITVDAAKAWLAGLMKSAPIPPPPV